MDAPSSQSNNTTNALKRLAEEALAEDCLCAPGGEKNRVKRPPGVFIVGVTTAYLDAYKRAMQDNVEIGSYIWIEFENNWTKDLTRRPHKTDTLIVINTEASHIVAITRAIDDADLFIPLEPTAPPHFDFVKAYDVVVKVESIGEQILGPPRDIQPLRDMLPRMHFYTGRASRVKREFDLVELERKLQQKA